MMRRYVLLSLLFLLTASYVKTQIRLTGYHQADIATALLEGRWQARWISMSGEPRNVYGVYHFRKSIDLPDVPSRFIVHVSADNRYKLYVNGTLVSLGPARGDIYNWNFETVDIAPYLQSGRNVLAAVVWNYAEQKPVAQISYNQTGFLLQGNTDTEAIVNTDTSWCCLKNEAYSPWNGGSVRGYYVAGPGEKLDVAAYPWGWEAVAYDDSQWQPVAAGMEGAVKGARDYPGRLLVPSPIPPFQLETERFSAVRKAEGVSCPADFLRKPVSFTIPANTSVRLLLDNSRLTTGYFSLLFSKGKAAEITIGYAEALYEDQVSATTKSYSLNVKGNRNEVEGKRLIGYEDKLVADGGESRLFTSLWWRTWRYVEVTIQTATEPLVLNDVYGTFSAYPFTNATHFEAPENKQLNDILDIGWRTARLCANETYMDCPYYEQLQYFGDTRIQAMVTLYNTTDRHMVKNAIEQGRQSIVMDGITMSRYPSGLHQFISSFSLWWICMGHDYWMYRGDNDYMKTLLPAYRGVLSWYEQWLKPDYSLGYVPHWFFADWAAGFDYGEPVREKDGNSAFQDLMYLLTLDAVAQMEETVGISSMALYYKNLADRIRQTIQPKYWDAARGLFADTHDHRSFSQHVNALAVLAGIVEGEAAAGVVMQMLRDTSLIQATIYFRYYVHQALQKAGLGDQLLDHMQIWYDQMALGLTTWAEMPEPSRSDCHAWGASPNIEFFRIILGINSDAPGFARVRIAPSLGKLKAVSGKMPHPKGEIAVSYKEDKKGRLTAHVALPEGVTGIFVWRGKEYQLSSGEQKIVE